LKKKIDKRGIDICPICNKEFLHNAQSIYKLNKKNKIIHYCSYTCWRKAGGDK
jgi:hypothetical protein